MWMYVIVVFHDLVISATNYFTTIVVRCVTIVCIYQLTLQRIAKPVRQTFATKQKVGCRYRREESGAGQISGEICLLLHLMLRHWLYTAATLDN